MRHKPLRYRHYELFVSLLCLAADEDQLIIPVDVALADAQQRIQPDAGVVEDLERAKPEPGGSDACAIASAALGADLHVEPIAGAQDGFGCDGFACSPGGMTVVFLNGLTWECVTSSCSMA